MAPLDAFVEHEFFGQILANAPDGLFLIVPENSSIVWCNQVAHDELGYTKEELLGHSVLSLQKDIRGLPAWNEIAEVIRRSHTYVFVGRHRHKLGHEISVELLTRRIHLEGREFFLSSVRNITKRRTLEADILSRDERVRFALNEASDGLWDWHIPSGDMFFSSQLKRMLGYGPHEMPERVDTWKKNIHPDDAPAVFQALSQHLKGRRERFRAEYRLKNRNGHYVWVSDKGRICERDEQGRPIRVVGMVQDITDQKTLEHQLLQQAAYDSLTGLRNRRESDHTLQNFMQICTRLNLPLGLCMFDLDHFKKINDIHGHLVGDQVLVRVAQTVQQHLRAADAVFRWGGEEFLLLCPGLDAEGMYYTTHRLRELIAQLDWPHTPNLKQVTASFGIAIFPFMAQTGRDLLLAADKALYQAKATGRNRVVVCPTAAPNSDFMPLQNT